MLSHKEIAEKLVKVISKISQAKAEVVDIQGSFLYAIDLEAAQKSLTNAMNALGRCRDGCLKADRSPDGDTRTY